MKIVSLMILALFLLIETVNGQVSHQIITNRKIALLNKGSNRVLSVIANTNPVGSPMEVSEFSENPSQFFEITDVGNGNYNIIRGGNLLLSLKFNDSPGGIGRILVQDNRYIQRLICNTNVRVNCPPHQTWTITPVANESQTFIIKNPGLTKVLQANNVNTTVSVENENGSDFQKWIIAETNDLILSPFATEAEISEFNDVVENQYGVAVLNGDTTKPFYYHHNRPNERIYKYKKRVHTPFVAPSNPLYREVSLDAWYPVKEFRQTVCGRVKEYKQCTQDRAHDGTVNLDIDANLHVMPNPKFSYMLKNPLMESFANGQYYQKRLNLYCQQLNCSNEILRKQAENKAKTDVQNLLEEFAWDNLEGEFTPSMSGNPRDVPDKNFMTPINPLFKFDSTPINTPTNLDKICMYGPWMWERILYEDWSGIGFLIGFFQDNHFNNEIHPANQVWFWENDTLNLIAVVDQTGYFEVPSNPGNNTEVHASGLNQRMRFHVAFKLPATILSGDTNTVIGYHVNGKGFKFNNLPANNVNEIVLSRKYKNTLRFRLQDNSFSQLEKTHRVFLENVKKRPDGSIQGYMVIETEPITRRGGSINIFVKRS